MLRLKMKRGRLRRPLIVWFSDGAFRTRFSHLTTEGVRMVIGSVNAGTLVRQLGSVFFPGFKGQPYLAMLAIYLSDIGTEGDVNCFMGGFIATVERWAEFSNDWS